MMHFEDCHRCRSPKIPGHGMVCTLSTVSDISFWIGILLLVLFWAMVVAMLLGGSSNDGGVSALVYAINAALMLLLSLATGMRYRWLRHELIQDMEQYLVDGSCCGGSCAGSCGDITSAELGTGDDDEDCCGGDCCEPESDDDELN